MTRYRPIISKAIIYTSLYIFTGGIILSAILLDSVSDSRFPLLRAIIIFFASILLTKYFLYMILSPLYDIKLAYRQRQLRDRIATYRPLVSVMIPAWNEGVGVLATIQSLLESSYTNLEVVVVNDGSTDNTDAIVRTFAKEYEKQQFARTGSKNTAPRLVYYACPQNGGKGNALNTAIRIAQGDILISIDADCIVEKNAVSNFVKHFADPTVMAAVGNVKIGNTKKVIGMVQYLEFLFSFYFKKADSLMNSIYIIGGAAGAFRREVFERVGDYSTTNITEDIELSVRIQDAGMKINYVADAIIYTEGASDLNGLMKQRLRWKRGRFETFLQHRNLFFSLRKRHNKILTCVLLPLALFAEIQLFLEILFLGFLYIYSFATNDFSSFLSGVIIVSSMFFVQMFFDEKKTRRVSFFLLSPIGWVLFYLSTFVEYQALLRSVWGFIRGKEVKWQRWQRTGAMG